LSEETSEVYEGGLEQTMQKRKGASGKRVKELYSLQHKRRKYMKKWDWVCKGKTRRNLNKGFTSAGLASSPTV